jgi:hypothetical protein
MLEYPANYKSILILGNVFKNGQKQFANLSKTKNPSGWKGFLFYLKY